MMPKTMLNWKVADETAAPFGRSEFGNVDGAEDRRRADAEAADETEYQERRPVPCEAAADGRYEIEDGGDAEGFAAAEPLTDLASAERTDDGADKADRDGKSLFVAGESCKGGPGRRWRPR